MFHIDSDAGRPLPGRWAGLVFLLKAAVLRWRRRWRDRGRRPLRYMPKADEAGAGWSHPVIRVEKRSALWGQPTAVEFPLTAGKVENLRRAMRDFHGLEIPAGRMLSFWRQLGRPVRWRGFVPGRELREGCVIPAVGGGLCQLSGLLYQAALEAGLEIVERHAHSWILPGSSAEQGLDATVFWNYVDLRLRSPADWRLEVVLTASELIVRILRSADAGAESPAVPDGQPSTGTSPSVTAGAARGKGAGAHDKASAVTGDCMTCGMTECFRHPAATAKHAPSLGHSAFLLDARWPEFDAWCARHSREGDLWLTPMDGRRWKKPNYAWTPAPGILSRNATLTALLRSFQQRRLPAQGAVRQRALLAGDEALARAYARRLKPACRHLVVSQNLLPHLWRAGVLGGRTFDVLMHRWPVRELQRRLDLALQTHRQSSTLGDFRAGSPLLRAEDAALAAAARLVTPHRAMAQAAGVRGWRLDWHFPPPLVRKPSARPSVFFPASRLSRKGVHELSEALRALPEVELKVLGRATESGPDPLAGIDWSPAGPADLASAWVLVIPAWIEHQPRLALQALANGIPVIATTACGLPEHPLLRLLPKPDAGRLEKALRTVIQDHQAGELCGSIFPLPQTI